MTKEEAWRQYYESDPSLFDSGLDEIDLTKIQESFYYAFDLCNKENTELKAIVRNTKAVDESFALQTTQLTKAKEIIRTLLLVADNKVSQMEFQLCVADAKQFIGEVEKSPNYIPTRPDGTVMGYEILNNEGDENE